MGTLDTWNNASLGEQHYRTSRSLRYTWAASAKGLSDRIRPRTAKSSRRLRNRHTYVPGKSSSAGAKQSRA